MLPPPGLGHVAFAIPEPVSEASLAAAVTTTLPSHHRPTIAVAIPAADVPTPAVDSVFVTMTSTGPTSAAVTSQVSTPGREFDNVECRLLGPFALIVQLALGGLALLALVYKRWRERPQRPVKIWFFDVSKQVFGSVLVHIVNVFMSMLTSGRLNIKPDPVVVGHAARKVVTVLLRRDDDYTPNPCSFYLLNLGIDTTIGIPILILLVRATTTIVSYTPWGEPPESIQSGYYGNPPNALWWLKQSLIYFCGLFGMKICVLIMFLTMPWIERVGDWALGWTEGNEQLQIFFVMMLFPLIMNALQYYIIDSFIKKEVVSPGEESETTTATDCVVYDELSIADVGDTDSSDDEEDTRKHRPEDVRLSRRDRLDDREYDPAVDGDSQTVVSSSSGQAIPSETGRLLPKHQ